MYSVPTEVSAIERARWLAELSEALDAARRLLSKFDIRDRDREEALDLYTRIEAARFQVQSLRLSRSLHPRPESTPDRIDLGLWQDKPTIA